MSVLELSESQNNDGSDVDDGDDHDGSEDEQGHRGQGEAAHQSVRLYVHCAVLLHLG